MPDGMYFDPNVEYEPIIDNFNIIANGENLQLTGPVGFSVVPEPMSVLLFAFGAFMLKLIKRK